jgi:guanosine-3',5'-bis(diphosphate) 3'-pyrophosphohydrolase
MIIAKALAYAARCHNGQKRKDDITPYFYHCAFVMYLVQKHCLATPEMLCAAALHDTVEDCDITIEDIQKEFGSVIALYVAGLTNIYTKSNYPAMNRKERKLAECSRLAACCDEVRQIKLCDRLANLIDMEALDAGFRRKFIEETKWLLEAIGDSHSALAEEIRKMINDKI